MAAFLEPFATFDPLTGEPPAYGEARFRDVIVRARALLGTWDRTAIARSVDLMDWLFDELQSAATERKLATLGVTAIIDAPSVTEARELFEVIGDRPPPAPADLPDATWKQLFAVTALAYVGETCTRLANWQAYNTRHLPTPPDESLCWEEAVEGLACATEAPGFAERFTTAPGEGRSGFWQRQGAAGAEARHRAGNMLKRCFIKFYQSGIAAGRFTSKAAASRQFQATLRPEEKEPFKNLDRIFLEALRNLSDTS